MKHNPAEHNYVASQYNRVNYMIRFTADPKKQISKIKTGNSYSVLEVGNINENKYYKLQST